MGAGLWGINSRIEDLLSVVEHLHSCVAPNITALELSHPICFHPIVLKNTLLGCVCMQYRHESFVRRSMNDLILADPMIQPSCFTARCFVCGWSVRQK